MANENHSIIGYFTKGLSGDIAVAVYQEYHARVEKINLMLNSEEYSSLVSNRNTIYLLLAASVFHKRVISNLDAAGKFFRKVVSNSEAETIKIGNYIMTGEERNRILAAVIEFNKLLERYNIPYWFFQYYSNEEFLNQVIRLKNAETQN